MSVLPSLSLLRAFYFLSLGALGAAVPFLGAQLAAAGVSGHQIGMLMAMLPLGRLVSAPLWGWLADRFHMAGLLLRIGCAIAVVGDLVVLYNVDPTWAALGIFLFSVGRTPLGPLVDSATLQALAQPGNDPRDYGRVRLWGSIGFLGFAIACGHLADLGYQPLVLGAVLLTATAALAFRFPTRGAGGPAPVLPALRALLAQPFLVPLLAMGCLQAMTLSVYDTFFSTHVRALGLPSVVLGEAIALGVACEVVVMALGRGLLGRIGAPRALLLAALVSVPRWLLTAWVHDPVALVAVQMLHGVSFGVFWIAGVQLMADKAPIEVSASAQSLFAAASYGVGALVGALLAGELHDAWGTAAIFEGMAVVSCGASLCAGWLVWRERPVAALGREEGASDVGGELPQRVNE